MNLGDAFREFHRVFGMAIIYGLVVITYARRNWDADSMLVGVVSVGFVFVLIQLGRILGVLYRIYSALEVLGVAN